MLEVLAMGFPRLSAASSRSASQAKAQEWLARLQLLGEATKTFKSAAPSVLACSDLTMDQMLRVWDWFERLRDQTLDLRKEMKDGGATPALVMAGDTLERIVADLGLALATSTYEPAEAKQEPHMPMKAAA